MKTPRMGTGMQLALVVALGAGLRLFGLTDRDLWLDEATSLTGAAKPIAEIVIGKGFDFHTPPLYYTLLHFWLLFFPDNSFGLRLFSVACDSAAIFLIGRIFAREFGARTGIISALIYALMPFSIYYGQEGRMYSLLAMFVMLGYNYAQKIRVVRLTPPQIVLAVLICSAGLYTHYYFAFILAALTIALTAEFYQERSRLRVWYLILICSFILYLPWVEVILKLTGGEGQSFRKFIYSVLPYTFLRFSAGYAVMPLNFGTKDNPLETVLQHWPEVLIYFSVFSALLVIGAKRLWTEKPREFLHVAMPLLLPAGAALLISLKIPMLGERYLIVSFPFFVLLIAVAVQSSGRILSKYALPAFTLCLGYALGMHYFSPDFGNSEWTEVEKEIAAQPPERRSAPIVVNPEFCADVLRRNLSRGHPIQKWSDGLRLPRGAWLVESAESPSVLEQALQQNLEVKFKKQLTLGNGIRIFYLE